MFLSGCQNQQTDLPTVPAASDITSAPTQGADQPTTAPTEPPTAETDNEPAGDKPTTEAEFRQLLTERGYVTGTQTTFWWDAIPDAPANQYGGQAQELTCGSRSANVGYMYSIPGSDGIPDGQINWSVILYTDPNGEMDVHGQLTNLPDCSTLT